LADRPELYDKMRAGAGAARKAALAALVQKELLSGLPDRPLHSGVSKTQD
jgi:hypothetical protein